MRKSLEALAVDSRPRRFGGRQAVAARPARRELIALAKSMRKRCPRSGHAVWSAPRDRPDPVSLVKEGSQGRIIFDIHDLDETLPAPWEWDVKRLAVSFVQSKKRVPRSWTRMRARASIPTMANEW
jgi:hypothetical protein